MRWGGLIDFSTAALPHPGDTNVGGPGLTTSDVTNETDLEWAGENEYASFAGIGSGYNSDGSSLPPGTVAGRGGAVSSIKYAGSAGGGGAGTIVNPGMIDSPLGDPVLWLGGIVFGGIAVMYWTKKDEDKRGVLTEIGLHGSQAFIFFLFIKAVFERFKVAGLSEVVEFA